MNGHPTEILPLNFNIVGRLRAPPQEPPVIPATYPHKLDTQINEWAHVNGRKSRRVRDADDPEMCWDNPNHVAAALGCSHRTVYQCCDGKRAYVKGRRLEWCEEE